MAKRKKYPKLPNGFGSIKYLGRNRRNPYGVYPPCQEFTIDGVPVTRKALCYVDDWMKGFAVLTAYQAGTYTPGMESSLGVPSGKAPELGALARRILADYSRMKDATEDVSQKKTFAEVYKDFYHHKFEEDKSRTYSKSSMNSCKAAFRNCAALHDRVFADLKYPDLQKVVDDCPLKHSSLELIVSLIRQMYEYALIYEIVDKDYSSAVKIKIQDDDEHGEPFTQNDLSILWKNKQNPVVEMLLIMCYSGYRITAYKTLKVDLKEKYFQGGVKTVSGKNRIVPIHSAVLPLVKNRLKVQGCLIRNVSAFRADMYSTLEKLGIKRHTPHDCRHTFSALCEKYGVNENDRKRMMGHSFGSDITNGIYGHRTTEELRTEIEKIPGG